MGVEGGLPVLFDTTHALVSLACSGGTGQTDVKRLTLWVIEASFESWSARLCQL